MSAVGCCGHSTVSGPHSTAQHHSLSLPYFPSPWRRLVWAHPARAPRLHAHHSAAPGAPWRREAHRRAVRSSRGAVPAPPHHTTQPQPHTGTTLTLTTFTTFSLSLGRCTVGTQWMVLLLVGAGGRIHFQNTLNTEYAANFWRGRLVVVRAIFAVISSTL